jgi:glycosyltransferase involved in cell wall biosynthesis
MKIVYLNPSGQLGGAERSLLDILWSVRAAKPDWSLHLVVSDFGPLVSQSLALGVPTTVVPFPARIARLGDAGAGGPAGHQQSRWSLLREMFLTGPAAWRYVRRLRRTLRELAPDVIHSNGFKMHILAVWARLDRVPIIWHIHDYVSTRPMMAHLLRRYAKRCALAVANSRSVAADVEEVCGRQLTVKAIYNGIDLENFSPAGPALDLDALSGLPPANGETVRVGMLATMARWKGHETFLRAMALIPPEVPVRGYIAGAALYQTNGSQHSLAELKQLARTLGVSHRIGFTGFVDQPAAAMRALDIVVHASTQPEPFGLVIVEGMACGRAVIASDGGGAVELITSGADALRNPPGDPNTLAGCITRLATDSELRLKLGQAGRITAEQRFDRARLATELVPIYQNVIASGKRSDKIKVVEQPSTGTNTLRVLHVHSGNLYGGVETLLATLARNRDLCPTMESHYALCFEGRLSEELNNAGATVYQLGKTRISRVLSVRRARRALNDLLQREHFDLAVCHSTWSQSLFGPVLRSAHLPLVFWLHNPTKGKHWLDRWGSRTTPDLVLCNSEFTAATASNLFPGVRSEVAYCPVAPPIREYSQVDRKATRAELQTPDDVVVIIQASRMESWKGHALHLEGLSMLKDLPGWLCWMVGGAQRNGEIHYLETLKRKAAELGIADRVRFLGQRSDVEQLLAAADIYCQPNTEPEPFGIAFIEALYAQLPIVTTAIGGVCEIVDDSCGVFVPPSDAPALAASLRRLIQDQSLRARLGTAGPGRARQLCKPATQMRQLQKLLSGVVRQEIAV